MLLFVRLIFLSLFVSVVEIGALWGLWMWLLSFLCGGRDFLSFKSAVVCSLNLVTFICIIRNVDTTVVSSISSEWTSWNFMLPPTKRKQGLLYFLPEDRRSLWSTPQGFFDQSLCWFHHLHWHKHFSTLQWCLRPESQSAVMSGLQKDMIIFLCKGNVFPLLDTEIILCLDIQCTLFFFLQKCPWNLPYKKPGPATHPEVLVRPLPWKQDSWWSRFHHPVHEREYCTRKYQEASGSKYLHSCVLTPR